MIELQIFDEQDGVAAFVIQQLVHQVLSEQYAEATRTFARFCPYFDLAGGGNRGVGEGGARQKIQGEAGAGIVYMHDDGPRGMQNGGAHTLVWVVLTAVF